MLKRRVLGVGKRGQKPNFLSEAVWCLGWPQFTVAARPTLSECPFQRLFEFKEKNIELSFAFGSCCYAGHTWIRRGFGANDLSIVW